MSFDDAVTFMETLADPNTGYFWGGLLSAALWLAYKLLVKGAGWLIARIRGDHLPVDSRVIALLELLANTDAWVWSDPSIQSTTVPTVRIDPQNLCWVKVDSENVEDFFNRHERHLLKKAASNVKRAILQRWRQCDVEKRRNKLDSLLKGK